MGTLVALLLAMAGLRGPQPPSPKCVIALAPVGDTPEETVSTIGPAVAETFGC